ncbi:hypothetical protein KKG72_02480 [bacterium]|nr:hypothetical protein [bacterium]MBU1994400.1 hypothetical protein [bacterium]
MKKFNLFKEIIVVSKSSLLQAINSSKQFGITLRGEIKHEPFSDNDILIYQGVPASQPTNALMPSSRPSLQALLGKNYQIVEDDDRVLIKAFSNWQAIIGFNTPRASYDDTTGDGVAEFASKDLEDIGWNATEFNISYRSLVDVLEENCEGTLICIEQEEPYQFSGLGFLSDNPHAKKVLLEYCQNTIKELIETDDDYKRENLTDDEIEATEFFQLS